MHRVYIYIYIYIYTNVVEFCPLRFSNLSEARCSELHGFGERRVGHHRNVLLLAVRDTLVPGQERVDLNLIHCRQ